MHDLTEEIAEQMISCAPDDLERLETEITDAEDPPCHPIAAHLNECLNQIAALSPTDLRAERSRRRRRLERDPGISQAAPAAPA